MFSFKAFAPYINSLKALLVPRTVLHQPKTFAMLDTSPPIHRCAPNATSLDRSLFRKSLVVLAARVPQSKTGVFLKAPQLRGSIINIPKVRSVVHDESDPNGQRLVLLRYSNQGELKDEAKGFLESQSAEFVEHKIELDYDYWTAEDILRAVLPNDLGEGIPSGFTITGHLGHFNLRDEYLPYKYIIGQVVLDKNKKLRTVVNKLDNINNQFRFFDMELIAGEPDYIVEHHESDCRFTFDFKNVYWNSRLHTEHERLVNIFRPEDGIVADVFAGVGPFAVPAARHGCAVLANDLNPESAKWLTKNVQDNKVSDIVRVSCEDGRDFIRAAVSRALKDPFPPYASRKSRREVKEERKLRESTDAPARSESVASTSSPPRRRIAHFVMNLPDTAILFLDAFRGLLSQAEQSGEEWTLSDIYSVLPMVHCHCFTRFLDPTEAATDIRQRVQDALGCELEDEVSLHMVRSVAPNKDMYCISFRLPRAAAYA